MRNPRTRCGSLRIGLSDEHSAVGSCNSPTCRLYTNVYNSIFELLFKILYRAVEQKLLSLSFSLSLSIIVWSNLQKKERNRERERGEKATVELFEGGLKKEKIFEQFEKADFHRHTVLVCVTIRTFQANYLNRNSLIRDSRSFERRERERKKFYFV